MDQNSEEGKRTYNEYMRAYMIDRYERRRREAIQALGGECVKCGSTEELEFDHVDPESKLFSLAKGSSYSEKRWSEELAKCQLLCDPCHKKKTQEENPLTHGKYHAAYKYKCECSLCLEFKKTYNAKRRERRRMTTGV